MARYFTVFVISLFALLTSAPAFADTNDGVIGTILEVDGTASVTPAGGQAAAATVQMPVHLNDVVETGAESRVFILFIDNTQLTLSEKTKATIDNYVFDPDDNTNNKASYSVLQGAFQYVSGLIGKKENPDVHIDTAVGSIGIRGTDFWAGNLDNQYNVAVNDGQVALKTDAGESVVNKGEGTSVRDRHAIPARAQAWSPERFRRIAGTVHLRHDKQQMMKRAQGRQRLLRSRYKKYMAQHRNGRQRHQMRRNQRQNHSFNNRRGNNLMNNRQQRTNQRRGLFGRQGLQRHSQQRSTRRKNNRDRY